MTRPALPLVIATLIGCYGRQCSGLSPDDAGSIRGLVVDRGTRAPLAGLTVRTLRQQTVTGADGTFMIPEGPRTYDIAVLEAGGSSISFYRGLTRRDPILVHKPKASRTEREASVALSAPTLLAPQPEAFVTAGTRLSWSRFAGGVHVLELNVGWPIPDNPNVHIYTADVSATLGDLALAGVAAPDGAGEYTCTVRGLGRRPTLDGAAGPQGIGAANGGDDAIAHENPIEITLVPIEAFGPPPASCAIADGTAIVCNDKRAIEEREFYMPAAMNAKLRLYPRFAATFGGPCVRDCAGARAFTKAYADYKTAHPDFDTNQPLRPPPIK